MLVLLDTSALIWWMHNDSRLGAKARDVIGDGANQILVSALSIHEYTIKARLKKLSPLVDFRKYIGKQGFFATSFTVLQADAILELPTLSWKDPFDLALIAQAHSLRATLLTSDRKILKEVASYVTCLDAKK